MATLLAVEDVHAGYGPIEVLKGISIEVRPGEHVRAGETIMGRFA